MRSCARHCEWLYESSFRSLVEENLAREIYYFELYKRHNGRENITGVLLHDLQKRSGLYYR
jgi:hypothetical protein